MGVGGFIKGAWKGVGKALTFGVDIGRKLLESPVAAGVASAGGQVLQNEWNKDEAQRNRDFQERMSSTAVQRSVADYEAAGLNPALAYERSAVGGSGASAVIGNPMEAGLASARAFALAKQQMRHADELHAEQLRLMRSESERNVAEGGTTLAQGDLLRSQMRSTDAATLFTLASHPYLLKKLQFEQTTQPYELRSRAARAAAEEYSLPSLRSEAAWAGRLGIWRPALHDIIGSARSLSPFIRR